MEKDKDSSKETNQSKNTISNSSINAGGNVHIGDIINIHQVQQKSAPEAQDTQEVVEKIQGMIMQNQISEALEEMLIATKEKKGSVADHAILLTQQWNSLQSERRVQLISEENATVRANRIVYGLSELVKELGR
jgi:hypothetical protein